MATWHNPANLSVVAGGEIGYELRLPLLQACFDRARDASQTTYQDQEPGSGPPAYESFGVECNRASPFPTGQLGFARSFDSGWGFGVGFFTPAAVPNFEYGSGTILTRFPLAGETVPYTTEGVESSNRFLLLERRSVAGWLTAGIGVQPAAALRVGMSVGLGFANLFNRSVASVQGGTFADQEVLQELEATDWAIPRFMASVVAEPFAGLESMFSFTYLGDIEATGNLEMTANGFEGATLGNCRSVDSSSGTARPAPGVHCVVEDVELAVPMPTLEVNFGVRYASKRSSRARVLDRMKDENWDIEVNAYWSQTSNVDQYTITVYKEQPGTVGAPHIAFSTAPNAAALASPPEAVVARNWNDTFGVRAGGDYNVLPELLALRMGVSYESRAVPAATMNIDAFPVSKIGLHLGSTLALGSLRLHLAYAHLFYQDVIVPVGTGEVLEIVSQNPQDSLPVNEGSYSAALDVVSLGGSVKF